MDEYALTKIGLTKAESLIYLTLLKLGSSSVKQIAQECGFHRPNIYDILEQLKEKGLVTFQKVGKVVKYKTADPENLYNFLNDKQITLDQLMPDLKKLQEAHKEEADAVIFKGKEGLKSVFRDMLRQKKTVYGFGVSGQLRKYLPEFGQLWIKRLEKAKIKYYGIYTGKETIPSYYTQVRFVSKELMTPVATLMYGDKIFISIWEPSYLGIVIQSKQVVHTYMKHFRLLWKIAKKV